MDMNGWCSDCDEDFTDSLNNLDGTMMIAAWRGHVNCARTLIEAGADVNSSVLTSAVIKGRDECVNLLLEAGADVNTQKDILHKAAAYDQDKCLDLLLKAGADANKVGCNGNTALMLSAESGKLMCLELLIKAGADVNTRTQHGSTVLITAAKYEHFLCVQALLHAGALVNVCDDFDNALTQHIIRNGKWRQGPNRKLCMLLFAAGERVQATSEGNVIKQRTTLRPSAMGLSVPWQSYPVPVPEYLKNTSPGLCLKEKCREVIRSHLLKMDLHQNLFVRVSRLGLPTPLSKYLLYGY